MIHQIVRWLGLACFLLAGSAVIVSGINSQLTPFEDWTAFDTGGEKILAQYSYFTLWSNFLAAALGWGYFTGFRGWNETVAKVLRIDAAMMMLITGLVFNIILASSASPDTGLRLYTSPVLHTIMPVLAPLVWVIFVFGGGTSKREITLKTTLLALIIPAVWTMWTLIRGTTTNGYYPYGFINAHTLGWGIALRNIAGIYVGFFIAVSLIGGLERVVRGARAPQRGA